MSIQFRTRDGEPTALGRVLLAWWEKLDDDRGGRATLRRATSPTQVALTAPYQRVFQRLRTTAEIPECDYERIAAIVGLLARVKTNESRPISQAMSECEPGGRPPVSELRFLRLLDSPDIETFFTGLRRVLPLMNDQVDVLALANDVFFWGDGVKKQWAYAYRWPEKAPS